MKPAEAAGQPLLDLVRRQVDLGPRYPGSEAHRLLARELAGRLEEHAAESHRQRFTVRLPGGPAECGNLTGIFRPAEAGRPPALPPLLLGTHFDTRSTADREPEQASRARPIPGANDGGSGTAILLSLLPELARAGEGGEAGPGGGVVFFDAEDVGDIDGQPFSLGAGLYAREPPFGPPRKCWSWTWWAAAGWCWTSTGTSWTTRRAWSSPGGSSPPGGRWILPCSGRPSSSTSSATSTRSCEGGSPPAC